MNESGDPLTQHSSTPDTRPCSIISIIPNIGMSSCRGRAEAFARSLSSKLRTLGSQTNEDGANAEDEPIINGGNNTNTWVTSHENEQTVTDLQPLRHESDSFFDFDCELESPGSPVDECEYLRLIETASNTPHNSTAESGYACASAASSHSSTDGHFYDATATATAASTSASTSNKVDHLVTTQQPTRTKLPAAEVPEYVNSLKISGSSEHLSNGLVTTEAEATAESTATTAAADANAQGGEEQRKIEENKNSENSVTRTAKEETLPTTGPDEIDSAASVPEVLSVQDQILNELQQESDKLTASETSQNGSNETEKKVIHIISNGHTEHGEEVLQIIETEIENTASKEAITTEEEEQKDRETTPPKAVEDYSTELKIDVDIAQADAVTTATATAAEEEETKEKTKQSHHHMDTTDDEDDCRPQRIRRCSSLKTGKTPPGTPGRKKIVRFADVLGLDLADVKTFLDEIPTIPKSAFEDLEILEAEPPIQLGPKSDKLLMPLFQQPGGLPTFLDVVREKQVSLENAAVTDNINHTITGTVRVRNLDFHKSVHIRYSLDGWRSFADLQANYVENSCDGFSDKFTFVIFGNSLHVGQRLEFAVRFQCKGQQFWDNNYGANYCFQCLPSSNQVTAVVHASLPSHHSNNMAGLLSPTVGDAWCSSFY